MASRQRRTSKRTLRFSPESATKELKKKKTDENREGRDGQRMDSCGDRNEDFDIGDIHEIISTRVNETLAAYKGSLQGDEEAASSSVIQHLVPMLATTVAVAVTEAMKGVMKSVTTQLQDAVKTTSREHRLLAAVTRLTYDNDRLQQYTRRESLRIHGIKTEEGETAEQVERKALRVFADAGVDIVAEDMAAVHRAGKAVRGSRPILVKFVSRRKRRQVMDKKKDLKGKTGYDHVFINDDLTPLRARLLGMVKRLDHVERAWTVDGRIHCVRKSPPGLPPEQRPRPIVIDNPDDLFDKLGVDSIDYAALGLSHLDIIDDED